MKKLVEIENVEILEDEFNAIKFTLLFFNTEDGKKLSNRPYSEVTHILKPCEITDNGWLMTNSDNFPDPEVKEFLDKTMKEYWTEEIIDAYQLEFEKAYVEKHIRFNATEGAISLDEIDDILSKIGEINDFEDTQP